MSKACSYNISGQMGIELHGSWMEPSDEFNPHDWDASERAMMWTLGWLGHPIITGEYPEAIQEQFKTIRHDDWMSHFTDDNAIINGETVTVSDIEILQSKVPLTIPTQSCLHCESVIY